MAEERTVVVLIKDLMFRSRVREVASTLEYKVESASSVHGLVERLESSRADVVILDLASGSFDEETLWGIVRASGEARLLAFGSHVRADILRTARRAGFTQVMPNSEFSARLPELLRPDSSNVHLG